MKILADEIGSKVVIRPTNKKMENGKKIIQKGFDNLKGWAPDEELREMRAFRALSYSNPLEEAKKAIQLSIEKMKDICKR